MADLIAKQEAKKFTIAKEDKNKALTIQAATMAWNHQTMRPNISYEDAFKGMQRWRTITRSRRRTP